MRVSVIDWVRPQASQVTGSSSALLTGAAGQAAPTWCMTPCRIQGNAFPGQGYLMILG